MVKDPEGDPRAVKGHIVAVRLAAESDGIRVESKMLAEDPSSPGKTMLGDSPLGAAIVMSHYADIAAKLSQPILAAALGGDFSVPEEIRFPAIVWTFRLGPLAGTRFVGGIYAKYGQNPDFMETKEGVIIRENPLRLDLPRATFFGVEENIFRSLIQAARVGSIAIQNIQRLENIPFIYSAVSVLRDGSVVGPAEFFRPLGEVTF